MADGTPHSKDCSHAARGSICDCDCAGAMHSVSATGGHPAASAVTDRAKRAARAAGRPIVTGDGDGGRRIEHPDGTVTTERGATPDRTPAARRKRADATSTKAITAAAKPRTRDDRIAHVRGLVDAARATGMPNELHAWSDLAAPVTKRPSAFIVELRDEARVELAAAEKKLADERAAAKRKRYHPSVIDGVPEVQLAQREVDFAREQLRKRQELIDSGEMVTIARDYPTDANGNRMPSAALKERLDASMAVGKAAHEAIRKDIDADPEIARLKASIPDAEKAFDEWLSRYRVIRQDYASGAINSYQLGIREQQLGPRPPSGQDVERKIKGRERQIIRDFIGAVRPMGGAHVAGERLTGVQAKAAGKGSRAGRRDADARFKTALEHFPADWVALSDSRARSGIAPLRFVQSDRPFYSPKGYLAMHDTSWDKSTGSGGFSSDVDETNVHETGHRMETIVPGLTALEFAYVRQRSTGADGNAEKSQKIGDVLKGHGYRDDEVAFFDEWARPYAGKTYEKWYEDRPETAPWEVFQVGLQELYGRPSAGRRFDTGDGLEQFTLGALLTLGAS